MPCDHPAYRITIVAYCLVQITLLSSFNASCSLITHPAVPMGKNKKDEKRSKKREEENKEKEDLPLWPGMTDAEKLTRMYEFITQQQKEASKKAALTRSDERFDDDTQMAIQASLQAARADEGSNACDAHSVMISEQQVKHEEVKNARAAKASMKAQANYSRESSNDCAW